ncbi:MAG TPA: DUF5753 domain-containing protein [Actinocatenispora sp.]
MLHVQSKISKIETGRTTPTLADVERILAALAAPADLVAEVMTLARVATTEWQDFRSLRRSGLANKQQELASFEASSTHLRYFLPAMVTGLLATPDYIRASLADAVPDSDAIVKRKLARQRVLRDSTKKFTFLLTEQAVRWSLLPPAGMAGQVDRLIELSASIQIGVIPLGTPNPDGPLNTFTIYDDRIVTAETTTGVVLLRNRQDIDLHRDLFARYESCARYGEDARSVLVEWRSAFLGQI